MSELHQPFHTSCASSLSSPSSHGGIKHKGLKHELCIENLSVQYGKVRALSDVNFTTQCGRKLALVGPNGAGKSTLLKVLAGLVKRTSGKLSWRGARIQKWSSELAYLPQREDVDWDFPLTVRGLVEMGRYPQLGFWRPWRKVDEEVVEQAMEQLDLLDLANRQIRQLSGGQQQRAFIARAVAQQAHVLLLDEPFTGLDRPAQQNLSDLLSRLANEGRLVIASHHELRTVKSLFDEVLVLRTKQLAFGTVETSWKPDLIEQAFGTNVEFEFSAKAKEEKLA